MTHAIEPVASRRRFINWFLGTSAGAFLVAVLYPVSRYLVPPEVGESTAGTVTEITEINRVMSEVHDLVASIATAVEEQAITTREIANNIGQAAGGLKDMTGTVTEAAEVSQTIASDLLTVSQAKVAR